MFLIEGRPSEHLRSNFTKFRVKVFLSLSSLSSVFFAFLPAH